MLFRADIDFYNELSNEDETEHLIIMGENYENVTRHLSNMYDERYLLKISLEAISPDNYILYKDEDEIECARVAKYVKENAFW